MTPTSCFTGQVHRLPDAPEAYGAMITRAKVAPAQSRSTDLELYLTHCPTGPGGGMLTSATQPLTLPDEMPGLSAFD
jgi:hypothetical protein